jgi:hypothetical protein
VLLGTGGCGAYAGAAGKLTGCVLVGNGYVGFMTVAGWPALLCTPGIGIVYELLGAGTLAGGGGAVVFWRAMFANAARIEEVLGAGGAGVDPFGCGIPIIGTRSLGGDPSGVVDSKETSLLEGQYRRSKYMWKQCG